MFEVRLHTPRLSLLLMVVDILASSNTTHTELHSLMQEGANTAGLGFEGTLLSTMLLFTTASTLSNGACMCCV